jgi:hypothetical protein
MAKNNATQTNQISKLTHDLTRLTLPQNNASFRALRQTSKLMKTLANERIDIPKRIESRNEWGKYLDAHVRTLQTDSYEDDIAEYLKNFNNNKKLRHVERENMESEDNTDMPKAIPLLEELFKQGLDATGALNLYIEKLPEGGRFFDQVQEDEEKILDKILLHKPKTDKLIEKVLANLEEYAESVEDYITDLNVCAWMLQYFTNKNLLKESDFDKYVSRVLENDSKKWEDIKATYWEDFIDNADNADEDILKVLENLKYTMGTYQTGGSSKTYKACKTYKIYNKRRYVLRQGSRGGHYILVKGKKVYV